MTKQTMKHWAAAAVVALFITADVRAEDSLFSGGNLFGQVENQPEPKQGDDEVEYSPGDAPGDSYDTAPPAAPERLTEENLDARLREAGLTPRIDEGQRFVDLEIAGVDAPALVALKDGRLIIAIKLRSFATSADITALQAQTLLQANAIISPAAFVFDFERKQLELKVALRNNALSPQLLKAEFDGLSKLATTTERVWSFNPNAQPTPPASQPQQPQQPPANAQPPQQTPPANNGPNLVGRWIVELKQGGGFVIRFQDDGKFLLGHVKADGKIDRSQGRFSIENGQLVLKSDDGSTLQGKFAAVDANKFNFAVGGGQGLVFQRR